VHARRVSGGGRGENLAFRGQAQGGSGTSAHAPAAMLAVLGGRGPEPAIVYNGAAGRVKGLVR